MAEQSIGVQEIANRKYIGPNKTGDNINADRAANYIWDGSNWQRMTQPGATNFIPFAYDYKALTQNSTQDIWTYKSGGSGGTLVATKTITYTDSTKSTISTIVRT